MIVARSIGEISREKNSVVTVGTFDGVHKAHQEIVREVVHRAKRIGGRSVVITFDPHPKEIVGKFAEPIHLLTTIEERIALLEGLNVDVLLVLKFTLEFSRQSSHEFYERFLVNGTGVNEVVVGYDHKFGSNRQGSTEELVRMGKEFDFSVFTFHPYSVGGEIVSSTHVRHALAAGEVEKAESFLGRAYSLRGTVVKGDGRGRTIGFPTANIAMESAVKMVPANGVYLVGVEIDGKHLFGMMNIGVRPTVTQGLQRTIEIHVLEVDQDMYGSTMTVHFLRRLRSEQRFASLQELVKQLQSDKEISLSLVEEIRKRK
jgi:riboflavin kinase / FMN adenylyltransferase